MIKNNKPLLIYGIIILVILVLILFVIPDDFFARKYQKNAEKIFGTETKESEPEYTDFEEQTGKCGQRAKRRGNECP